MISITLQQEDESERGNVDRSKADVKSDMSMMSLREKPELKPNMEMFALAKKYLDRVRLPTEEPRQDTEQSELTEYRGFDRRC